MLMTIEELRTYFKTNENDAILAAKLQALESMIRKVTNNNFQKVSRRRYVDISGGVFLVEALTPFSVYDTVQVSSSELNDGLYTVKTADDSTFTVNEPVQDESGVLVTLVEYPMDVKLGAVSLLKWDFENRDKVGIQSETISRHSVTYFNMDGDNSALGYPKSLTGFLKPYMKARF